MVTHGRVKNVVCYVSLVLLHLGYSYDLNRGFFVRAVVAKLRPIDKLRSSDDTIRRARISGQMRRLWIRGCPPSLEKTLIVQLKRPTA